MKYFALFALISLPVQAQTCPPLPDLAKLSQPVMAALQQARDPASAQLLTNQMWEIWTTAPDEKAQQLLDSGIQMRSVQDFDAALAAFEQLVDYCPDYAEGYNQRAFINFIRQDYALALEDLELALQRSPLHIAAQTGKALTLMQLGRVRAGQAALRAALALNPWLPERDRLIDEPGDDI